MSWSWRIGRVAGIPIFMHWTFLILLAWVAFSDWQSYHDVSKALGAVGFVLAIFGCVVLHELGHALAARRYGVPTADITLLPIGGVARLQRIPEHPAQELVVALAGPLVNVVIVGSLYLAGVRLGAHAEDANFLVVGPFLSRLMLVNGFLALFNLIPAFPMDGGRVLRALLAMRLDYARATRFAASIGQAIAVGFAFWGLNGGPRMLILIALFVWIGAEAEARQVQERLLLGGVAVRDAMLTDYRTLRSTDTLGQAAEALLAGSQHDFPVVDGDRTLGVLSRADLMAGLARGGVQTLVGAAMTEALPAVDAASPLAPAAARLRDEGLPCLRVVDAGRTVGLLTLENIAEYIMLRTALDGAARTGKKADVAEPVY
jgi:Zn-dependent protease/predicted transcriptional regulator